MNDTARLPIRTYDARARSVFRQWLDGTEPRRPRPDRQSPAGLQAERPSRINLRTAEAGR